MKYDRLASTEVYVETLSNGDLAAVVIVYPFVDGDRWVYAISGELHEPESRPFSTMSGAMVVGDAHLRTLLNLPLVEDPDDDGGLEHWPGDGPASWRDDPLVHALTADGLDGVYPLRGIGRPDPTRSTYTGVPRPPLVQRLRDVWKAWRL